MFITIFLISTDMYLRTNVPFQYTISGDREQVFLLYYKDFFEQICSDVQFISPPEEVGEFLLHLLKKTMPYCSFPTSGQAPSYQRARSHSFHKAVTSNHCDSFFYDYLPDLIIISRPGLHHFLFQLITLYSISISGYR